jgi:hypothetical protein
VKIMAIHVIQTAIVAVIIVVILDALEFVKIDLFKKSMINANKEEIIAFKMKNVVTVTAV